MKATGGIGRLNLSLPELPMVQCPALMTKSEAVSLVSKPERSPVNCRVSVPTAPRCSLLTGCGRLMHSCDVMRFQMG